VVAASPQLRLEMLREEIEAAEPEA
jgi:hypothetical protein